MLTVLKFLLSMATGGLSSLIGLIGKLPPKVLLEIACGIAALIALLFWNHHERAIGRAQDEKQITALATRVNSLALDLDTATKANAAFDGTVAALKLSNASCEAGRLLDAAHTAAAQRDYATQVQTLAKDAAKARAATAALLAGRCKDWAAQAACGVMP